MLVRDEIIETTDYAGIISALAGIPYSYENKVAHCYLDLGITKQKIGHLLKYDG